MKIQQVKSFKTSDNRVFEDRGEAITHEYAVNLRGFIQRNSGNRISDSFTSTQIAEIFAKHNAEFMKINKDYQHDMAMCKRYAPKPVQPRTKLEMLVAAKH